MILFFMIITFLLIILFCRKFFKKGIAFSICLGVVVSIITIPLFPYGYFLCLCNKNSGEKIYKTVNLWKEENYWEKNLSEVSWENVKYGDIPIYFKKNNIPQFRDFNGKQYELSKGSNQRILEYNRSNKYWSGIILHNQHILFDDLKKEVLIERNYYRYYIDFFVGGYSCGEASIYIRDFQNSNSMNWSNK